MKRIYVLVVAVALSACAAPIVKKPAVFSVKKMAIVSLYANRDIYDVKEGKGNVDLLSAVKKVVTGEEGVGSSYAQIATLALGSFSGALNGTGSWEVVSPSELIGNPAYKEFVDVSAQGGVLNRLATADRVTPPGMAFVPFEAVVGQANTIVMGEDPTKKVKADLAALATRLGVDGVAVIDLDLAYKRGFLSGMSGTGIFSGVRGRARPSVACAMVMVTRDGAVAVQTKHIQRGGGARAEAADSAPMLHKGLVDLSGEAGQEAVARYGEASEGAARLLKAAIEKEIAKP